MGSELLLVVVVGTALVFDFTNGFHDTANAMATSIATRALRPRVAVLLSAVLNFAGAFISIKVATTIAEGIVDSKLLTLNLIFAALVGALLWNLTTWALALPSSSSHALIGGIVGATLIGVGSEGVNASGIIEKVVLPGVIAPVLCGLVAMLGTLVAYRMQSGGPSDTTRRGYRYGQIGSASLVSLAHGTNDAQKTMGVITLALVVHGTLEDASSVPLWVKVAAATSIALGTYIGGWRIIRTLGTRLTEIESPQGFVAEGTSTSVLLASSYFGYPLSTTQVVSGGVLGVGLGKRLASVRWGLAGGMAVAWVLTLPMAGVIAAGIYEAATHLGNTDVGPIVMAIITAAGATGLFAAAQRNAVTAADV
jgi:PiT family inorganic phosphate transporter